MIIISTINVLANIILSSITRNKFVLMRMSLTFSLTTMQDPEQYRAGNNGPRQTAKELLSKYIHQVKWRHSDDEVILDIGCGPGDITCEVLKPLLPRGARLIGADICEKMVNYAAQHYPDTTFMKFDIGTKKLKPELKNAFDHVFSFYCFHWIQDQRQVFQNIYDLLKPGGDMFVFYIAQSPVFDANIEMAKTDMWKNHMPNNHRHIPPHQTVQNPEINLQKILNEVGFTTSVCKRTEESFNYPNKKTMTNLLLGVNPYYPNLPQELKQQFREDIIREFLDLKELREFNNNYLMSEEIKIPHKLNVIFATKP